MNDLVKILGDDYEYTVDYVPVYHELGYQMYIIGIHQRVNFLHDWPWPVRRPLWTYE